MKKLKGFLVTIVLAFILILSSCNESNEDYKISNFNMFKYEYYPVDGGYGLKIIKPSFTSPVKVEEDVEYLFDSVPMGNEELVLPSYYNGSPILEINNAYGLGYDEKLKTVVLPEKLEYIKTSYLDESNSKEIATYGFRGCSNIENIIFPSTLKEIEFKSFWDCKGLKNLIFPDSLTKIGVEAFENCIGVESVYIPGSVEIIEDYSFQNCSNLTDVYFEDGVKEIGVRAFASCTHIKNIRIPDTLESVGAYAFQSSEYNNYDGISYLGNKENPYQLCIGRNDNSVKNIEIKEGCKYISASAFSGENIQSVSIPSSVKRIFDYAFYNSLLNDITLQNGIESLGTCAFNRSSITSIDLPDSITHIGDYAFAYCNSLESIKLSNSLKNIRDYTFTECEKLTEVTIPSSVITIGEGAFKSCTFLEKVNFSKGLKDIQDKAFSDCINLKEVTLPDGLIRLGIYSFMRCTYLKTFTFSDSVQMIPNLCFYNCESLETINLPNELRSIGVMAFSGCTRLTSISFPEKLEVISNNAFSDCPLKNVIITKNIHEIGDYAFKATVLNTTTFEEGAYGITYKSFSLESVPYYIGDSSNPYYILCNGDLEAISSDCKVISKGALYLPNNNTSDISIKEGVIRIDDNAFIQPKGILSLPNSLESLGSFTISDSSSYYNEFENGLYIGNQDNPYMVLVTIKDKKKEEVEIHSNCKFILSYAFLDCDKVKEIIIPNGVKEIGQGAFCDCSSLEKVVIPNSVKRIKSAAFSGCKNLKTVVLPDSITTIESYTFSGCESLEAINIPNSVVEIKKYAFKGTSLKGVKIPDSVKYIGTLYISMVDISKGLNDCLIETIIYEKTLEITFDGKMEEFKDLYFYQDILKKGLPIEILCKDGKLKIKELIKEV